MAVRQVQQAMGMPVSIDIPNCNQDPVFRAVFARFHQIDQRYSPYRSTSEVSRFAAGKIDPGRLSQELKKIISGCRKAEKWTNGYFSAWAGGAFDPSGYVKGWAVAEAGKILQARGYGTFCIGAGGDILAKSTTDKVWNIGIQDPLDKQKIQSLLSICNGAVATSGNYQRGAHIINPKTNRPANELLSVTISGPDIIAADILATACCAMGKKAAGFMKSQKNYDSLIVENPLAAVAGEVIGDDF